VQPVAVACTRDGVAIFERPRRIGLTIVNVAFGAGSTFNGGRGRRTSRFGRGQHSLARIIRPALIAAHFIAAAPRSRAIKSRHSISSERSIPAVGPVAHNRAIGGIPHSCDLSHRRHATYEP